MFISLATGFGTQGRKPFFDETIDKKGAVVVALLVERSIKSRGPQFVSSHQQNLYRTFVFCQLY